jgi:hypothetical protein
LAFKLGVAEARLADDPSLDLFAPETLTKYFNEVYSKGEDTLDSKQIQCGRREGNFKTVGENFKMIPDITETVFVPFDPEGLDCLIGWQTVAPIVNCFVPFNPTECRSTTNLF